MVYFQDACIFANVSAGKYLQSRIKQYKYMKHLIVGGVAGGATAAARIRRIDESAEIILFEKGKYISYANCGLPYYIGGTIAEREKLLVQTVAGFSQRLNVDVRVEQEVVEIDRANRKVKVRCANGRIYDESYDRLLLSPGASPVRPPLPGIDSEGIFTLRNVEDTDHIKAYITQYQVRSAVIIGGGFIGLEMAENLHDAGVEVAVVEMADQVMAPIDFSMASLVHEHLLQKGVRLYLKQAVSAFAKQADGRLDVSLASGQHIATDMVVLSIGVRPNTRLAEQAGIELGEAKGIKVNSYLQTSDPYIYAVGDAIEYPHPLTGKPWLNYLAGPANRQARLVADNMVMGNNCEYEGAIGTSIAKVFDLTVAATGLPAKRLKQWGMDYLTATLHPNDHAGYYPGAVPMTIKLVFQPHTGKLYGAQIVGRSGVDKRIDQIALAIKHGDTVADLTALEQVYAPPFSSAKDPVAMAGYVAQNILSGKMTPVYWREMQQVDPATTLMLDVRTADEFALGSLPGAVNVPLDDLRDRLSELPADRPVIVFCGVGMRGYLASNILKLNGWNDVRNLVGGLKVLKAATASLPVPKPFSDVCKLAEAATVSVQPVAEVAQRLRLDACGLSCPGPILKLKQKIDSLPVGQQIEVLASDPGFPADAEAWCQTTGNTYVSCTEEKGLFCVCVQKGAVQGHVAETGSATVASSMPAAQPILPKDGKTFILFSDDLDKALATFVLANGAAATGKKVTIFFTFWGLNAIKKEHKPQVKKDFFGRMFSMMLPSSSLQLKLSKMNMGGIGRRMMRSLMKRKGVDSLESLRQQAVDNGVEFIACQMSMDVMGVAREELLDNVKIGGVATYMNRAEQAGVNLFI